MTDDNKPIDLKQIRMARARAATNEALKQIREQTFENLKTAWSDYRNAVSRMPDSANGLRLSDDHDSVFDVLLTNLVELAQALGVTNENILESLLISCTDCRPEDRLGELIDRAFGLALEGDEYASKKFDSMADFINQGMTREQAIEAFNKQWPVSS